MKKAVKEQILSVAISLSAVATAFSEPILKVGFMTDTHMEIPVATATRVRQAFELFKAKEVDAVMHCGDLADWHYPEAYAHYRKALDDTFKDSGKRPDFFYVHGNHDALNPDCNTILHPELRGKNLPNRSLDLLSAFKDMDERLGITHPLLVETEIKGIPFFIMPESWGDPAVGLGVDLVDKRLTAFCDAHPGKPIVVLAHLPPKETVLFEGRGRGNAPTRRIFEKHPQIISFTGHNHYSLHSPRCIWQGSFTALHTGTLELWRDNLNKKRQPDYPAYGVLIAEFWADKLVVRRFDVRDGSEIDAENRWTVPLPFDPATAPYTLARQRAREKAAAFPSDAKVDVLKSRKGTNEIVKVVFPLVQDEGIVEKFRVDAERRDDSGIWKKVGSKEMFSSFHIRPSDRKGPHSLTFDPGELPSVSGLRIVVTPVGFFGKEGPSLVWTEPNP